MPGVSATSFSPGASRPVLRGFQGDRVRVLVDGIGSIDASNASADHAVTIDPLTADRIEVLRGPAVLLYGSSAIGGAVNVIDKRIPLRVPDEPVHLDAHRPRSTPPTTCAKAAPRSTCRSASGLVASTSTASWRKTDDVAIPGFVLVRAAARRSCSPMRPRSSRKAMPTKPTELLEAADLRGVLPDSATET